MSRAKGTPKTGGRAKGTPNKVTSSLRDFLLCLVNEQRGQIKNDLSDLQPYQRLCIIERFMSYVIPKQQPINPDKLLEMEYKEMDCLIDNLPDEAIDRITAKLIELQKWTKEQS